MTREMVEQPVPELHKMLSDPQLEERAMARELVQEYAARFHREHGLKITFTEGAMEKLTDESLGKGESVRDLCASRFKNFHFGLKLIAQNSGKTEFLLDATAVETPDKVLSDWVVESYRGVGSKQQ